MNMKKILCALLSLVMVGGALLPAVTPTVSAAYADKVDEEGKPLYDYLHTAYASPEDKLSDMVLVKEQNGKQLYYEEFTGEVAFRDVTTGQILFSNPWDVAKPYNNASDSTKQSLLSQIIITYVDNGTQKTMTSYAEAALRGQIAKKNIKNGIRVEYTIGEEQTTRLVPRMIEKSRFEEFVLNSIDEEYYRRRLNTYYTLQDPNDPKLSDAAKRKMYMTYPITQEGMAVYVCADDINNRELRDLESIIKKYCQDYSYQELDYDHQLTKYVAKDAAPPLFKMAIEYTITPAGDLEARLPANGIRFDESVYKLKGISLLPYFGTGSNEYTGYTLVPDGSGTLVRFEDLKGIGYNISGQLYGADYAYHSLSNQHTEIMRWPVFGTVTNYDHDWEKTVVVDTKEVEVEVEVETEVEAEDGTKTTVTETKTEIQTVDVTETYTGTFKQDVGFLAIITEGDSQATMKGEYGGSLHCFNTVYAQFNPRPSDEYNLAESMSAASNAMWSVESDRKYTGSYRVLYKMLTDDTIAAEKNLTGTYSADYIGMAEAYRDYLTDLGALTPLTDTTEDIPLYVESFGSIVTTERILTFPVEVDTPLTTFEDVKAMYTELIAMGVGRLNFRLSGFANGGMVSSIPYKLNWMDVLGGKEGFNDLLADAGENGVGIFPDFDFVYVDKTEFMDGMSLRKYAVKTIDDRYTSKRYYDAATQSFTSDMSLCVSSSAFEHFYDGLNSRYQPYGNNAISVSTLGSDLNSDFDPEEQYNREDSKEFTMEVLEKIAGDYENVMVDGGNSYVLPYANHILNIATDSSRFLKASEAIPFIGIVLHGSKYLAGTPINMEGDISSAVLKAIENGSNLYFMLSYQNTNKLKDYASTSKYYSVAYEIWKEEMVEHYQTLNEATKDLQTSLIVDHAFLYGERVPDADEAAADAAALQAAADAAAAAEAEAQKKAELDKAYEAMTGTSKDDGKDPFAFGSDETVTEETVTEEETEADEGYAFTKYTTPKGSIVRVEYEGGVNFLLNYNSYDVTVEYDGQTYAIEALGFVRIH